MFKKYLTLIVALLVINLSLSGPAFADTTAEKATKAAEKVKANITKLGTGKEARVEIRLRDNTRLKGYVSQINENNFIVVTDKTGASSEVAYANAKQVKGNNLSSGAIVLIGVAAFVVVLLLLLGNST